MTRARRSSTRAGRLAGLLLALVAAACAVPRQAAFRTPGEALEALATMLELHDAALAEGLFGAEGVALIRSGDDVADREDGRRVRQAIGERVAFEPQAGGALVALLGEAGWPFPIPLTRSGAGWRFDVAAGIEELENRRVGRNELSTLATLHAWVDAQREYFALNPAGGAPTFAERVVSSPGARDGLYWPTAAGEPESPFGPQVAEAESEGYREGDGQQRAFHGYVYRTLDAQGQHAPGGARSYRDAQGRLTRGCALLAWPARYGSSGVMTFVVNQQGIVFEQDLGPGTAELAAAITAYDPDASWRPTAD